MRYHQPDNWPIKADYTKYIQDKIGGEPDYLRIRRILVSRIQKLGVTGADELILKLSSYLSSVL